MSIFISSKNPTQCKNKFYKMESVIFQEILGLDETQRQSFVQKRVTKPGSKAKFGKKRNRKIVPKD